MSNKTTRIKFTFGKLWWNLVSLGYYRICLICLWFSDKGQVFAERAQSAGERADYWHDVLQELRANE
ncbi:MAG: hypothetical protein ACK5X3_01910 [Pseudomonadota bacterium]|jgi:hypothetical protein